MFCGLPSRDSSEDRADGHAEASEVATAEDVPGHGFASCVDAGHRFAICSEDLCAFVHGKAAVSERDAGTQRVRHERRCIDAAGPMALGDIEALGTAVV